MSKETKEQLATLVAQQKEAVESLTRRLQTAESESRMAKNDSIREAGNARNAESRLQAVREVIGATLQVKHSVGVEPITEYIRGQNVAMEETNEDIRLLRYLYSLANDKPPF